jgi:hypothetical protein
MPTKSKTNPSTKRTVHLAKPITQKGTVDKRFKTAQFTKKDGTRDMRTTSTNSRGKATRK